MGKNDQYKSPHKEIARSNEERACDAIKRFGSLNSWQLAEIMNISKTCATRVLVGLAEKKILLREKNWGGAGRVYSLRPKGSKVSV